MSFNSLENFKCLKCGNCCRPKGWVKITDADADALARHFNMEVRDFLDKYTLLCEDRRSISLKEKSDDSCIFLAPDNSCEVNDAKPIQCREFPFKWNYDGWKKICRGVRATDSDLPPPRSAGVGGYDPQRFTA